MTSRRELISYHTTIGQGLGIEYNLSEMQKDNTENSVDGRSSSNQIEMNPQIDNTHNSLIKTQKLSQQFSNSPQSPYRGQTFKYQLSFNRKKQDANLQNKNHSSALHVIQAKQSPIINTIKLHSLVKKFIRKLRNATNLLKMNTFESFYEEQYDEKSKNKLNTQTNEILEFLQPSSKFIQYWDQLLIAFYILCYWITFFLSSFIQELDQFHFCYYIVALNIIILDSIIESQRGLVEQGEIILEKQYIFKKYIKQQLIQDILQISCVIFILTNNLKLYSILTEILSLVLISISIKKTIKKYSQQVDYFYLSGTINNTIYDLLTLIIAIICFAHAMACIWHYVGQLTLSQENCWLRHYSLENESIMVKYNYSFYWATMTMVTVGYGDITPQNQLEMLFANILMLCSTCMFAYSMNSIGLIVKNIYDSKLKYKRQLISINSFMLKKSVNASIQTRIRNFIKNQLNQEQQYQEELNQILMSLPDGMLNDLKLDIQMKIINKMKVLQQSFSQQSLIQLASKLEEQQLASSTILNNTDINNPYIYYVEEGELEICDKNSKQTLQIVKKGESFGYIQFFVGLVRTNSIRQNILIKSRRDTKIYRLSKRNAMDILKKTQKDWEKYHEIKDQILFQKDYSNIEQKCYFCQETNHVYDNCNKFVYQPDLELVIKKCYFTDLFNQRKEQKRYGFKLKSLKILSEIQSSLQQYQSQRKDQNAVEIIEERQHTGIGKNIQTLTRFQTINRLQTLNKLEEFQEDLAGSGYQSYIIDSVKSYSDYLTHNNIQSLIANMHEQRKVEISEREIKQYSKYTFNFQAIKLMKLIHEKIKPKRIISLFKFRNQ